MPSPVFERMPSSGNRRQLALFRKALWEEHSGICGICALPVPYTEMHVDHVVPVSLGGSNDRANLQPAHPRCNIVKGGRGRFGTPRPAAARCVGVVKGRQCKHNNWMGEDPPLCSYHMRAAWLEQELRRLEQARP